jgi:uncharacterized membrane protein
MNKRPKIAIPFKQSDKVLEILGWAAMFGIWVLTLVNYFDLPETIPIHYNAAGEADGFGDKTTILALPSIATLLFLGLTALNQHPHVFNYPSKITQENALIHYTNATRMIRVLKLVIVFIFGMIAFKTIQHVHGNAAGLGTWFLPVTMVLIFIPIVYFLIATYGNISADSK